jgi:hypothetical protein
MVDSHPQHIATADISTAILTAPGWARIGITMPDEAMRERAAEALAQSILERIGGRETTPDPNQLPLAL